MKETRPNARISQQARERFALGVIVFLYLAVAVGFALVNPYPEAPDESSHLKYIEYMVDFGKLPLITGKPYTPEAQQPPLYYIMGTMIVLAGSKLTGERFAEGRIGPFLRRNPDSIGSGGQSVVVFQHPPADRWPLWPLVLRGFSILLGLCVVLLTYATARILVPTPLPASVPLVATTFAALTPQANFIRASVSNDNLSELVGAWVLLLLALHLMRPYRSWRVLWLGVAIGIGLLTKQTTGLMLLPVVVVLLVRRTTVSGRLWRDLAAMVGLVLLLAGPFYLYQWITYGDPLASYALAEMMPRNSPWQLADLFWLKEPFRSSLWTSFWGVYGWQLIYMPGWIYAVFGAVTLLGVAGGIYLVWRHALNAAQQIACAFALASLLLMYGFTIVYSTYIVAWQGRLLFPTLSGICLLFGFGVSGLILGPAATEAGATLTPRRQLLAKGLVPILAACLLAANVYSIFGILLPVFST